MKATAVLRSLKAASRLSVTDWMLFLQAWVGLLFFDIGLRTRSFPDLQAFAARLDPHPARPPEQVEKQLCRLRTAVDRAGNHHLYPMTCLRRALTLQKLLARRGIAADLKIGVHKCDDQLSAHAWLEYQGKPLGEPEQVVERFSILEQSAGRSNQ